MEIGGFFFILFYFNEQSKIYLMASVLYTQYISIQDR